MTASLVRLLAACSFFALLAFALPFVAPRLLNVPPSADLSAPAADDAVAPSGPRRVTVDADGRGNFVTYAVIDGVEVKAVIDTGATVVALTEATAGKIGIHPPQSAYTVEIATANGVVHAAPVTLSRVSVGNVSVLGVRATVVPGDALGINLLGMTFLRRLSKFESTGAGITLTQ
jgi:aspartyl protease family protein